MFEVCARLRGILSRKEYVISRKKFRIKIAVLLNNISNHVVFPFVYDTGADIGFHIRHSIWRRILAGLHSLVSYSWSLF